MNADLEVRAPGRIGGDSMKTGPAIADILKKEGVEYLFAYPVNHLIEACAAVDIRPIIVRQERIGLHMADAMSRLTKGRKMGVFCMQSGPGSENAYGGIAQAFGESVPLLVIPQGYPRRIAHVPPNFNSSLAMAHVAKHCEPITNGREVGSGAYPIVATGDVGVGNPFLGGGGPRGIQLAVKFTFGKQ